MSSDFIKFLSELTKIILSVIIGFFWALGSFGWMFIHAFPTGSNKPISLLSQIVEIIFSVIFFPLYIADPMSVLLTKSGLPLDKAQSFQITLFLVSVVLIYIFLSSIELFLSYIKRRNTPKI